MITATQCRCARLGPKAFEFSAGFLRISNGDDPLDASGVHPYLRELDERRAAILNSIGQQGKLDAALKHPTPLVRQQAVERRFGKRKRNRRFRDGTPAADRYYDRCYSARF
jgi:transcriptional accessory protein Tex/SPT6